MIAFASSLDQAGPFTRDVTDAALLLGAMVGQDPCDSTSLGLPEPIDAAERDRPAGHPPRRPGGAHAARASSPACSRRFEETLELARELGATVETMQLPHAPHALAAYYLLAPAEASSNLARYDGVRYGLRADGAGDLLTHVHARRARRASAPRSSAASCSAPTRCRSGYYDAYYGRAQKVRTRIAEDFTRRGSVRLRRHADQPAVAFELGAKLDDPLAMYLNDFCAVPMSLAGIPAISIPNGLADGLPTGFQIAGPAFSENRILDAAHALEQAIGFDGSARRAHER